MEKYYEHRPVLLDEVVKNLIVNRDGIYIDATFGRGGHSKAILSQLSGKGFLLAIDRDPEAVKYAYANISNQEQKRFAIVHGAFSSLFDCAKQYKVAGQVAGILFDLGVSSPQLEAPSRGFSFMRNGPLDMRMDPTKGESVATWLTKVSEETLTQVLHDYGEERFAKRIARAIVNERTKAPITTTIRLAQIIATANPSKEKKQHPATRCFQAMRIFINDELNEIKKGLDQALHVLAPGGRLGVISFHSLEDRIVKRFIRYHEKGVILPRELPIKGRQPGGILMHLGKAIRPSQEEVIANPRARSSVLRIAEKVVEVQVIEKNNNAVKEA